MRKLQTLLLAVLCLYFYQPIQAQTGGVGINTTTPDTTLHVVGSIKMEDGHQADGYIMTSDIQGVARWRPLQTNWSLLDTTLFTLDTCLPDPAVLDAHYDSSSSGYAVGTYQWQAFTPEESGLLMQVDVHTVSGGYAFSGGYLNIYDGGGAGGTLLYSKAIPALSGGWASFALNDAPVNTVAGSMLTIELVDTVFYFGWTIQGGNPYAGGNSTVVNSDLWFRSHISTCELPYLISKPGAAGQVNLSSIDTIFFNDGSFMATAVTDTDDQTLSLSGNNLSISEGNSVDLSSIGTDTDEQTLSLNGDSLSISSGNTIDLSLSGINTDEQMLSLIGDSLSISNGNIVDLSGLSLSFALDTAIYTECSDSVTQDASNGTGAGTLAPYSLAWQSVTPTLSGYLDQVDINLAGSHFHGGYLRIYEGTGNSGTLLYSRVVSDTASIGWLELSVAEGLVRLTSGSKFTIEMEDTISTFIWRSNSGTYTGGRNNVSGSTDFRFRTFIAPCALSYVISPHELGLVNLGSIDTIFFADGSFQTSAPLPDDGDWTVDGTDMYSNPSSNVGIGTVSPDYKLQVHEGFLAVSHSTNAPQLFLIDSADGSYWSIRHQRSNDLLQFTHDNTVLMLIESTGEVGIGTANPGYTLEVNGTAGKPGGGSWINTSDARLKQNVQAYTDGLESVLAIEPVTYHYKQVSGFDTEPEYVGVLAQELQEVAPYMVGSYDKDGEEYLNVDNSAMTYMLINAVKELHQLVTEQQAEIEALKQQIAK